MAIFRMPGGILRSHALWKKSGLPLRKNWKQWAVFDLGLDANFPICPRNFKRPGNKGLQNQLLTIFKGFAMLP